MIILIGIISENLQNKIPIFSEGLDFITYVVYYHHNITTITMDPRSSTALRMQAYENGENFDEPMNESKEYIISFNAYFGLKVNKNYTRSTATPFSVSVTATNLVDAKLAAITLFMESFDDSQGILLRSISDIEVGF